MLVCSAWRAQNMIITSSPPASSSSSRAPHKTNRLLLLILLLSSPRHILPIDISVQKENNFCAIIHSST
uniref:Uncharacterized protein n=1 Tax=Caenorhabditis japonica TaxID=281687 RepID=A0A8R1E553_CAEJA